MCKQLRYNEPVCQILRKETLIEIQNPDQYSTKLQALQLQQQSPNLSKHIQIMENIIIKRDVQHHIRSRT